MKKRHAVIPAVLGGLALAVAVPLSASAHVTLNENTAKEGSYTMLTFRVPNESSTATTDKVELHIPDATPFADVSYLPTPGWSTQLVSTKLATPVKIGDNAITDAVTHVIWTADDSGIQDGSLQEFSVFVGPVPDVDKIVMTVDQTYSDGTVAKWEDTGADAEEPAPVLYVNATPPAVTDPDAAPLETASTGTGTDVFARVIGIVGVVVGVVGVVIAIASRRRRA